MIKTITGAQRYNARLHNIFEDAKKYKTKWAIIHGAKKAIKTLNDIQKELEYKISGHIDPELERIIAQLETRVKLAEAII